MARTKTTFASTSPPRWSISDAVETYSIARWGGGYFSVGEHGDSVGNVLVTPTGDEGPKSAHIDMKQLVDDLRRRGIELPILLRFSDILRSRIELLNRAFADAMSEYGYAGEYRGVYPIKVNQSRQVVEEIINFGDEFNCGLEAGSKPELLAVIALHRDPDALIICNGYKDSDYIETALLASRLGRTIVLVVEKRSELDRIRHVARELGVTPTIGIRARLAARGSGRWEQSGGDRSKFGLAAGEMLDAIETLRGWGWLDRLQLVHFHLGSQISSIRSIKNALVEAARLYAGLHEEGCSALRYFDVGGGLGVDYDGSQTSYGSSINYSVQEYANDVVFTIQQVCDQASVPHPTIVSESGRAVTAHHSVLIVDVLGVTEVATESAPDQLSDDANPVLRNLHDAYQEINPKNLREQFHDAVEYKEQLMQLFSLGHLSLAERVTGERMYWAVCSKALAIARELSHVPREMQGLEKLLSDTYFCNFSMFQSLPDLWAVDQQFPIMPIHRLHQRPSRRGILADITCDSDGAIDSFIGPREDKSVLELHATMPGEPYYLGVFLVGAYQEILGDMHNLFGDTNRVHVSLDSSGHYSVGDVISGDTVGDVLRYVGYDPAYLVRELRRRIEDALRAGTLTAEESRELLRQYQRGINDYTYLTPDE